MAEVYRGVDTVLDRTVAIKIMHSQFARDASFVERFRREAQAAARLNHPNIVSVFDSGVDGETQFIVMEFIEGRTLADFMGSGGRFGLVHAIEIAETVCDALAYAHVAGVVHRDIKPANIMVTRMGVVKVTDFGIARIVAGPETAPQTSAVLGTAAYISPEQAQGKRVDGRTDIYSLGSVLYEMIAGRPPFTGDSPVAIAYKQVNEIPSSPSTANADVTPSLDAVVMRALAKNPANRYQTADELRDDLERSRQNQPVLAPPLLPAGSEATQVISRPAQTSVLPPQEPPPGSGRKVWLGVLIGILAVGMLAGGGYVLAKGLLGGNNATTTTTHQVPFLIGQTQTDAISALRKIHLKWAIKSRVTTTVKPGKVVDQNPPAGTVLAEGSPVTIVVAKAPTKVAVPDLSLKTVAEATALLQPLGLTLTPTNAASDTVPVGQIVSQQPLPGAQVVKNTPVTVVVSTGPSSVSVPDLTCLPYGSAVAQLNHLGLSPMNGGTTTPNPLCPNPNRVALQDPPAGTTVNAGSTVTLFTGAASPTISPTPSPTTSPTP
jgi:serine/threonine-protein kinase